MRQRPRDARLYRRHRYGSAIPQPDIENLTFEGHRLYYGATIIESQLCGKGDVIVISGGNSAGQAGVYLSAASKVHILVRSLELSDTMSRYLIQRIEEKPNSEFAPLH